MYVDMCRHLVEDLLKFVENLSSTAHLAGGFKSLSSLSESLTHFIEKVSNTPLPPPLFELDGDTVKVYVGDPYILLGIVFATFSLLMAGDIYEISGMHEKWAYFVRRLRELSERFDVVDMRVLSQYMRKFGGYGELWDYVQRAVACGLLQPTEDSSPDRPKFYIVKEIPRLEEPEVADIREILASVRREVGKDVLPVFDVEKAVASKLGTRDVGVAMALLRDAEKKGYVELFTDELTGKTYYRIKVR